MSQRTTVSIKIPILPNGLIVIPGCEFSTAVTATTYNQNDIRGCENPTISVQKVLNAIKGSKVVRLSNGTGFKVMSYLELPSNLALDCCVPTPDWYKILKDLAEDTTPEAPDFENCEVANYNPYRDSLCADSPQEYRADPYVEQGVSQYGGGVI